jgi:hypothetical protein
MTLDLRKFYADYTMSMEDAVEGVEQAIRDNDQDDALEWLIFLEGELNAQREISRGATAITFEDNDWVRGRQSKLMKGMQEIAYSKAEICESLVKRAEVALRAKGWY